MIVMEDFHNIIKKAISEFGDNIITEVRFVNILSDYGAFEAFPSYKFVIKELINAGFMGKLLNEVAASKDYDVAKSDLVYQILQILPIQEQVLDHVLDAILSCYIKNSSFVLETPQGCSDSSSVAKVTSTKPKYITLSDLKQIGDFILGKTSLIDIKRKGYVMSNVGKNRTLTIPGNYGNLSNEYNLSSKLNVYSMYSWQRFPSKWVALGFNSELSFDEWGTLLKKYGFTVKKENEVNSWGLGSATKDVTYISHDNSIELKITYTSRESTIFDNDKRGTFESLSARALNVLNSK